MMMLLTLVAYSPLTLRHHLRRRFPQLRRPRKDFSAESREAYKAGTEISVCTSTSPFPDGEQCSVHRVVQQILGVRPLIAEEVRFEDEWAINLPDS